MLEPVTLATPAGASARILTDYGFNCFEFIAQVGGKQHDILWAEEAFASGERRPSGSGIPILFPFPGRLNGQQFQWQGKTYQLDSDDGRGNAIHGFVLRRPWRVTEQTDTEVTGEFHAGRDEPELLQHWPADFRIRLTYTLRDNSLTAVFQIDNPGSAPLPFGLGTHPYFRLASGPAKEEAVLQVPVQAEWDLQEMLPTGRKRASEACRDLQQGRPLAGEEFDRVFTGVVFEDGWCTTSLQGPEAGPKIIQRFEPFFRECVLYTPSHREAVCIEPYSCLPGGQTLDSPEFDTGWRTLDPGASLQTKVIIEVQ